MNVLESLTTVYDICKKLQKALQKKDLFQYKKFLVINNGNESS